MSLPSPEALDAAVREVLSSPGAKEGLTARDVRLACEQRFNLPRDGLIEAKEHLLESIQRAMAGNAEPSAPTSDKGAVAECVAALEDADGGANRASMLVRQLGKGESSAVTAEAMLLLCDACAASALATQRMIDAGMLPALVPFITPGSDTTTAASLAVRMLSAMSTHAKAPEQLLRSGVVGPLLGRLAVSSEQVGIAIAALLHNMADSPGSRFRLLHEGTLLRLAHVIMEPEASAPLKEHCLQAAASLAGVPEAEISFPQVLGLLCAARAIGTQREAVAALQLVVEKQPGVEARLAAVEEVRTGLAAAAGASDAGVAAAATELLDALQRGRL